MAGLRRLAPRARARRRPRPRRLSPAAPPARRRRRARPARSRAADGASDHRGRLRAARGSSRRRRRTADEDDHPHTETAWRLRHIKRSILKDSANAVDPRRRRDRRVRRVDVRARSIAVGRGWPRRSSPTCRFRARSTCSRPARSRRAISSRGDGLPRGVAYLAIGAPTPAGDWAMRGGDERRRSVVVDRRRVVRVESRPGCTPTTSGLSYSTQEYQGGNPAALAAVTDGSRNVGEIYALDRWTVAPGVSFEYGGRYARYDYLDAARVCSARASGFTLEPFKGTRVSAVADAADGRAGRRGIPVARAWPARGCRPNGRSRRSSATRSARRARALPRRALRARVRRRLRRRRPPLLSRASTTS